MGTMSEVSASNSSSIVGVNRLSGSCLDKLEKTGSEESEDVIIPCKQSFPEERTQMKLLTNGVSSAAEPEPNFSLESYGPNLRLIQPNRQVKELQTIIRDKNTSRSDFKFYADRLIRLVIEEGLNQLPYGEVTIDTPTGCLYEGLQFTKGNCGVSIVRSGEAMEHGLRLCCRSIRIGKILVESDLDTHEARVVYAKFPDDIAQRKVLLMYPIMSSGNTVVKSMRVLKEHAVEEENVILLNLFSTPSAARTITQAFPKMRILTSEVHTVAPNHFGQKYFGTD